MTSFECKNNIIAFLNDSLCKELLNKPSNILYDEDKYVALYKSYSNLLDSVYSLIVKENEAQNNELLEEWNVDTLLLAFWDNYTDILCDILYVCKDLVPYKGNNILHAIKITPNDKYLVEWDASGIGTDWQVVKEYTRPMSKAKTVAVFFMKWLEINGGKSLDEVRSVFPTSLNLYFARNNGKKSFDSLVWFSPDDIHGVTESGFTLDITNDAKWDLYSIGKSLFGLGYGPVYDGVEIKGKALIAKMWRKEDFENLLQYIDANRNKYFSRIRIVKA